MKVCEEEDKFILAQFSMLHQLFAEKWENIKIVELCYRKTTNRQTLVGIFSHSYSVVCK